VKRADNDAYGQVCPLETAAASSLLEEVSVRMIFDPGASQFDALDLELEVSY